MPDEPAATPPVTEEVWLKFLTDNEQAIRASAPREVSAQERISARQSHHLDTDWTARPGPHPRDAPADDRTDTVGDSWQPDNPWPSWRDLDGPARLRRVGRVIATAAAIALALGAWSMLSTSAGVPGDEPGSATMSPQLTAVEPSSSAPAVD
ncbi:hypothetical protein OG426_48040 [Streptomyces canus]|uniref:hypothetical protein n=1 Tax=Streptomyces canus TaxID=58343 RepID=UPI00386A6710|nr:hypothetical protein OG426_48040 [Streptomyces canus]